MTGKRIKRLLGALLALCLTLSVGAGAAAQGGRFADVPKGHWAYNEIMDVVSKGVFLGTGSETFAPEMEMTRAMFVTALARLAGAETDDTGYSGFQDVPTRRWYTGAVAWAADQGIVKGISETRFAPDQVITREQMATMILRYTDYMKISLSQTEKPVIFTDRNEISGFASDAVEACQRAGLLQGVGSGRFAPQGTATRSQVAVLISRLAKIKGTIAYTVTFETNGGTATAPQTVMSGNQVQRPTGVTRPGYRLSGWYTDGKLTQAYRFDTPVEGDITLYAKWKRHSSIITVTYPDPELVSVADAEAQVNTNGSALYGLPLTHPAEITVNGEKITLSGVYEEIPDIERWYGSAYAGIHGYVVPLKLSAPSSYTGGSVTLTVTGEGRLSKIEKTIPENELDGDGFFYLFKFVPTDLNGWNPLITVNWNGTPVSYTMDVTGMKKSDPAAAALNTFDTTTAFPAREPYLSGNYAAIPLTYAKVSAVPEKGTGQFQLYLSGGHTAKAGESYTVPLRFLAPEADFTGAASVEITGAAGNGRVEYPGLSAGDNDVVYLLKVPAAPGAAWDPVITLTWTPTPTEARRVRDETAVRTYRIDLSGMRTISNPRRPSAATKEQIAAATALAHEIAPYCADVSLTETSAGSGIYTVSGTYSYLPAGINIPGFGTVNQEDGIRADTLIVPILFYRPDGINLEPMQGSDVLLKLDVYRDGAAEAADSKHFTLEAAGDKNPILYLMRIDAASLTDDRYEQKYELNWFGGYTERFTVRLGRLQRTGYSASIAAPEADQITKMVAGSAFEGIVPLLTNGVQTPDPVLPFTYTVGGSYIPVPAGIHVPGFGTAGEAKDGLNQDFCILPFFFDLTSRAVNTPRSGGDAAVTIRITNQDGDEIGSRVMSWPELKADPSYGFLLQLNAPSSAGTADKSVLFRFTWYDGRVETFTFRMSDMTPAQNAKGAAYQVVGPDRVRITAGQRDNPEAADYNAFAKLTLSDVKISAYPAGNQKTALALFDAGTPVRADQIRPYYGEGYGDGWVVALRFTKPAGTYTQVTQVIRNGYTAGEQAKTVPLTSKDADHTLLLYIPQNAPANYAPELTLQWKGEGKTQVQETFILDLSRLGIRYPV